MLMRRIVHSAVVMMIFLAAGSLSLQAAETKTETASPDSGGERIGPSDLSIKPFSIEYYLFARLSREKKASKKELVKKAKYLKAFGGSSYRIKALQATPQAASQQRRMRKAVYLNLTGAHLRAAYYKVQHFSKQQKIQIKRGKALQHRKKRAYPVYRYIAGIDDCMSNVKKTINVLKRRDPPEKRRPGRPRRPSNRRQILNLEKRIKDLGSLKKDLKECIKRVETYNSFMKDINETASKAMLEKRISALKNKTARLKSSGSGIKETEVVGTQQVRLTISTNRTAALKRAVEACLKGQRGGQKIYFLKRKPDFLPRPRPVQKKPKVAGDYFITEYVNDKERVGTLFEFRGLWYRMAVLEYADRLCLFIPRS